MAEKNNDHLADALSAMSAMSAGEHHESEEPVQDDVPMTPEPSPYPSGEKHNTGLRPAVPVAKTIGKRRPPAPSAAPIPQGRPITPAHPTLPAIAPASRRAVVPATPPAYTSPSSRPPEPDMASSFISPDQPAGENLESTPGHEWMGTAPLDDDTMMAPAPDASAFTAHSTSYKSSAARKPAAFDWKPTLIPILLTTGVIFLAFSSLKGFLGPDSPYTALPGWVVGMVAGMGVLLLGLGAFTMMQVKAQLERSKIK